MNRTLVSIVLATAMVLALSTAASAPTIVLEAILDGAQANTGLGTGSPGIGEANILLDTDTDELFWSIDFSGLDGTPLAMHFHGPAAPGQDADVVLNIGVVGFPVTDSAILSAAQKAELLAGQ